MSSIPWGTDGVVSLPKALDTTDADTVDMEGFVFGPDGLAVNISHAEREDILAQGYGPQGVDPRGQG